MLKFSVKRQRKIDKPAFFRVLAEYFRRVTAFYARGSQAGIGKCATFFE
jgi:hypothetical protein